MDKTPTGGRERRLLKGKYLLTAVFAALFVTVLIFSALTPLVADDFSYKFSWVDVSRITSVTQIPASMAVHRQTTNGRVLAHGMVQFLLMLPKGVFDLLNGLCAVLLGALFWEHFRELRPAQAALLLCCGSFLIWNETPAFGQIFLWLDGAVNYFWGICLFLLFLRPYALAWLGREARRPLWREGLFLLAAFAAGSYSENGSAAALFAAVCLTGLLALRERRVRPLFLLGIAAAVLGFVFLLSAPAMRGRAAPMTVSALAANVRTVLTGAQAHLSGLYILYAVCFVLCLLSGADRKKLLLSAVYLLSGIGSLTAFVLARYFADRHYCFTVLFTVLACLLLLSALLERGKRGFPVAVTALAGLLFCFNFALGALDIAVTFGKSLERERAIAAALAAGERDVTLEIYVPFSKYSGPYGLEDLNPTGEGWPNDSVALYYGLDSVTGVEPGA